MLPIASNWVLQPDFVVSNHFFVLKGGAKVGPTELAMVVIDTHSLY